MAPAPISLFLISTNVPRCASSATRDAGPQRHEGAAGDPVAELALERDGLADHGVAADDGVDELHRGPDHRSAPDDRVALEVGVGQEPDVGFELDRGVDVGVGGVDHGDAGAHPPVVDPGAQLRLGDRELGPVVDLHDLHRVLDLDAVDHVAGLPQHRDDVGEVVLALDVLGNQAAQAPARGAPGGSSRWTG